VVKLSLDVSEPVTVQERELDKVLESESIVQEYKNAFPKKRPIFIRNGEQVESKHFIEWKNEALSKEFDEVQQLDSDENLDLQQIQSNGLLDDLQKEKVIDLEISRIIQKKLKISEIQFDERVKKIKVKYGGLVSLRGAFLLICKTEGIEYIVKGLDVSRERDELMIAEEAIVVTHEKSTSGTGNPYRREVDEQRFSLYNGGSPPMDSISVDAIIENSIESESDLEFMWNLMNFKMMLKPDKILSPTETKKLQKVKEVLGK